MVGRPAFARPRTRRASARRRALARWRGCAQLFLKRGVADAPDEACRDERERHRQHELSAPGVNAGADLGAGFALDHRHLPAARREHHGGAGAVRGGQDVGRASPLPLWNERAGGERQQLPFARGDRGAEEADPEREVLNDRAGPGNAAAEEPARDDLAERQNDHHQQRTRRDHVLEPDERALHLDVAGFLFLRYWARALGARSKMSGGTCTPRLVLARLSRLARQSGTLGLVTVKPALTISGTAVSSCVWT